MKREEFEPKSTERKEFEAPELTVIGDARAVVLGVPMSGWDHRGLTAPELEFQPDEEQE